MDIVSGLTAAKLALNLAKDLREIDKSVDEAAYKMKLAELMSALADARVALADAKSTIADLEERLSDFEDGSRCPKCREGRLHIVSVKPAGYAGGFEFHSCKCSLKTCDYTTVRLFDASLGSYSSNRGK